MSSWRLECLPDNREHEGFFGTGFGCQREPSAMDTFANASERIAVQIALHPITRWTTRYLNGDAPQKDGDI